MPVKRIRIEVCGNETMHKYHVTAQISAEKLSGGILGGDRHNPFDSFSFSDKKHELSDDTKATILRFYDIDGVASVGVDINEVTITKSPAFEWDEIEEAIIGAVKTTVDWQDDEDIIVDWLFFGRVYSDGVSREVYETEMNRRRVEEARYARMYEF